ncbi:MAG: GreA/GreB family elongation factor [Flavobacteriales bacterium]|nr:GreA/GreB family elongation factor [Flavobacteriales bacterium]MCB0783492.1 GreA/GreB family elongation factor [Flavobacteriales bacterium]MCB0789017.1 GreA/GreB family elongation factor [Flavobacteriales bacterium]MCB0807836.1 GreA/GreB family elongation factor [Flavobacteriales bacterium]MCB0813515.1 GreA/GreB family elongation factor [Flavobacteriales bacterium]
MDSANLIVSEKERDLMRSWIIGHTAPDIQVRNSLDRLYRELEHADVRKEEEMPRDVVRICSIVDVGMPAGRRNGLQLVMHADADLKLNKLSVLSVLGSALIGYRQGAHIKWQLPQGDQIITLEHVDNSRCDVLALRA